MGEEEPYHIATIKLFGKEHYVVRERPFLNPLATYRDRGKAEALAFKKNNIARAFKLKNRRDILFKIIQDWEIKDFYGEGFRGYSNLSLIGEIVNHKNIKAISLIPYITLLDQQPQTTPKPHRENLNLYL